MKTIHTDFGDPIKDGDILWRFMSIEKALMMLSESTLWLARTDKFEDPYEGQLPPKLVESFSRFNEDNSIELPTNNRRLTYASCWYVGPIEPAGMWKLYGGDGGSICIKTTVRQLKEALAKATCFPKPVLNVIALGSVAYVDMRDVHEIPPIPPGFPRIGHYDFMTHLHKRPSFAHENEVRMLASFRVEPFRIHEAYDDPYLYPKDQPTGLRMSIELNSLIKQVVVSPYSLPGTTESFRKLAELFGLNAPVTRSDLLT